MATVQSDLAILLEVYLPALRVVDLKTICREYGLPTSGVKAQLADRIRAHLRWLVDSRHFVTFQAVRKRCLEAAVGVDRARDIILSASAGNISGNGTSSSASSASRAHVQAPRPGAPAPGARTGYGSAASTAQPVMAPPKIRLVHGGSRANLNDVSQLLQSLHAQQQREQLQSPQAHTSRPSAADIWTPVADRPPRFHPSPFHQVVELSSPVRILPEFSQGPTSINWDIPEKQLKKLQETAIYAQMDYPWTPDTQVPGNSFYSLFTYSTRYISLLNQQKQQCILPNNAAPVSLEYPHKLGMLVNGKQVARARLSAPKGRPYAINPVDITPYILSKELVAPLSPAEKPLAPASESSSGTANRKAASTLESSSSATANLESASKSESISPANNTPVPQSSESSSSATTSQAPAPTTTAMATSSVTEPQNAADNSLPLLVEQYKVSPKVKVDCGWEYTYERLVLAVYLVRRNPISSIYQAIVRHPQRQFPKEDTIKRFFPDKSTETDDDDDELTTEQSSLSLKCPLSHLPIRMPIRGKNCQHAQCFDLWSFILTNLQSPTWTCPVCHASDVQSMGLSATNQISLNGETGELDFGDTPGGVMVCGYMLDIIQNLAGKDASSVMVKPGGEWFLPLKRSASDANLVSIGLSPPKTRKTIEVISLISDDEDEDDGVVDNQRSRASGSASNHQSQASSRQNSSIESDDPDDGDDRSEAPSDVPLFDLTSQS